MQPTMLLEQVLVLLLLKVLSVRVLASHSPELYFRLLQTDGQAPESDHALHTPLRSRLPSPSDRLPIDDLIENTNAIYDPRPKDLNVKALRKRLGPAYDKRYMSIHKPKPKRRRPFAKKFVKGRPPGRRPAFLKLLRRARLQDGRKVKLTASKNERRKFQRYVWGLTYCPVRYTWKNLGIRFWPPWIRKGSCANERSCSIPAGMKCKASGSTTKTFLRWHCENFEMRRGCQWIRIQYPIITKCSCSC